MKRPLPSCTVELVTDHDPVRTVKSATVQELEQPSKSTVADGARVVGLVSEKHRSKPPTPAVTEPLRVEPARTDAWPEPIARAARPLTPAPELSFDGQLDLRGMKVRADARGPGTKAMQRVLIVFILVAGAVMIVRSIQAPPKARGHEDRCTERTQRTEVIERTCVGDGQ
jgi:hypothetical protein